MASSLTCTWSTTDGQTGRMVLVGELDWGSVDEFLVVVTERLDAEPSLRSLHLDCRDLAFCDSLGLSALLTVRRRTDAAGVRLHLDNRGATLDRMLTITGTLGHLTGDQSRKAAG
jgi:anti-anti-sigma factor